MLITTAHRTSGAGEIETTDDGETTTAASDDEAEALEDTGAEGTSRTSTALVDARTRVGVMIGAIEDGTVTVAQDVTGTTTGAETLMIEEVEDGTTDAIAMRMAVGDARSASAVPLHLSRSESLLQI